MADGKKSTLDKAKSRPQHRVHEMLRNSPLPVPEPGHVADRAKPKPARYYPFKTQQLLFLDYYAEMLDYDSAGAAAGYTKAEVARLIQNEYIQQEIDELHNVLRAKRKFTAQHAEARHLQLMDKMEVILDQGDTKIASALSKMSGDYLKATGAMDSAGGVSKAPNIIFNIDISGKPTGQNKAKEIIIDG